VKEKVIDSIQTRTIISTATRMKLTFLATHTDFSGHKHYFYTSPG